MSPPAYFFFMAWYNWWPRYASIGVSSFTENLCVANSKASPDKLVGCRNGVVETVIRLKISSRSYSTKGIGDGKQGFLDPLFACVRDQFQLPWRERFFLSTEYWHCFELQRGCITDVMVGWVLLVTMELTFLFIYFICFYLYYGWQLESSGYSSLGLLSAVRRSYTT